ncbi:MAG: biotin synthase BioB [Candidatus Omnitrophota bacterium]|nr:biotin synthase BioB [Candidatus Omnitrophota bacterium]
MKNGGHKELLGLSTEELIASANEIRKVSIGARLEMCGIINAKSGACGENCKFCAQSAHHGTKIQTYPLKCKDDIISAAAAAKRNGASRFGIVTSGNRLTSEEIEVIADAVKCIIKETGIKVCASLGALNKKDLLFLKEAGLTRYHHNIETSERFYAEIVSTHVFQERIETIRGAKETGLEVCSGGILGMGETWQDRIDMAVTLKELHVDSVPMNFLVPIKGTPFENTEKMGTTDAIRAIAIFRIILGDITIKIAAGREAVFKDLQNMIYSAGANGMMVGGYLTVAGQAVEDDKALISEIKKLWNNV